jgi:hypothetical protein
VRYSVHVTAFLFVVANPFPGFAGAPRSEERRVRKEWQE